MVIFILQNYQFCIVFGNVHVGSLAYYRQVAGLMQVQIATIIIIILTPILAITILDRIFKFPLSTSALKM